MKQGGPLSPRAGLNPLGPDAPRNGIDMNAKPGLQGGRMLFVRWRFRWREAYVFILLIGVCIPYEA